uniref:Pentraxin 3, long b n=1 Tax=Neogobius melanostomus TaxID=47308 RepID=A0A8C6T4L2_9GOBI
MLWRLRTNPTPECMMNVVVLLHNDKALTFFNAPVGFSQSYLIIFNHIISFVCLSTATPSTAPCGSPDMTKWNKMFSMLENSQMRENMLLQYADDIIKVEMDAFRQEMLRFVSQYGGSCSTAVDAAGGKLALQLDSRFHEMLDRLKAQEDEHVKPLGAQQDAVLQQLLSAAQSQDAQLIKLESSCFSATHSKTGFNRGSTEPQEQEAASEGGHLEAALVAMQQSRAELQEVLQSLKQRYLPAGNDVALLFPMRSRRIYTSVSPETPLSLSAFTACLWVKPNAVSNKTVLLSYGNRQNPYEIQLLLSHDSALFTVGGEAHLVEARGVVNPRALSQWVHLCGAWSSEQGLASLWAGGKKVATTPGNGCCPLTPSTGRAVPGFEEGFEPKLAFAGKMTGVNIWDRVLSEQEISQLGQQDSHITEMVPHGGAQFIY